jgi:hypothetical protein
VISIPIGEYFLVGSLIADLAGEYIETQLKK